MNKPATAAFIKIDLELKSLYKDECSITNIQIYSNEKNTIKEGQSNLALFSILFANP